MHYLLFPFALIYEAIIRLRNWAFDKRLLTQTSFDLPIIVVGNLRVGGTGKTPVVSYLCDLIKPYKTLSMVSRGYGRSSKGFVEVSSESYHEESGDEPVLIKQKHPSVHVFASENRVEGINQAIDKIGEPASFILDDAMQHRSLKPGFLVMLTAYHRLFCEDHLLPMGRLREPRSEASRADVIVVTKCPSDLNTTAKNRIQNEIARYSKAPVLFGYEKYNGLRHLTADRQEKENYLKDKKVLAISGLADPSQFVSWVESRSKSLTHIAFPDHHNYSPSDIEKIKKSYGKLASSKVIVTTEKDAVRLGSFLSDSFFSEIDIFALTHEFDLFVDDKGRFDTMILDYVRSH